MKRIILGLAAMLMTFALSVGVYRLIWVRSEVSTPTVETVPAAIVRPVADVVPVTAEVDDEGENIPGTDLPQPRAPKRGEATR